MTTSLSNMSDQSLIRLGRDLMPTMAALAREAGVHVNSFWRVLRNSAAALSYPNRAAVERAVERRLDLPQFSNRIEGENNELSFHFELADAGRRKKAASAGLRALMEDRWFFLRSIDPDRDDDPAGMFFLIARYALVSLWSGVPLDGLARTELAGFALSALTSCDKILRGKAEDPLRRNLGRVLSLKASALQQRTLVESGNVPPLIDILQAEELRTLAKHHDETFRSFARSTHHPGFKTAGLNAVTSASAFADHASDADERKRVIKAGRFAYGRLTEVWPEFKNIDHVEWSRVPPAEDPDLQVFRSEIALDDKF
ncbi:hypothetical protein EN943_01340 [Mesorhizobium sp. M7A.F.Ca.US.006.01.1.1]|uniref:hypothetical protein n=1 Tax=Mesorhizobium sp. M7A.F.Ca.US.006.01.1.1 TaxID=2496707 RepID=UPI000FCB9B0D|nr:hypothetical protein [Mesorhizobium sp. M7A.F.Ca.US.006.01.1.1]RUZ81269.1 hypothetical protein EN943_01340 [Mesorhizobium sp. M7A.F.Ca.US.006.01.1.1]